MEARVALAERVRTGDVCFLVGSAVSVAAPTNLPTAQEVVKCILEVLAEGTSLAPEEIESACHVQFEGLFSMLFRGIGEQATLRARCLFHPPMVGCGLLPNPLHEALHGYAAVSGQAILTTNYDKAIESCGDVPPVYGDNAFASYPATGGPAVLKLHGDVDAPDSMVIAVEQTSREVSPSLRAAFKAATAGRALCTIGYSGLDIDILPLVAEASWRELYWISRPSAHWEPHDDAFSVALMASRAAATRRHRLFELAERTHRAAYLVPLDLFATDGNDILAMRAAPARTDADARVTFLELCRSHLREAWCDISPARRAVTLAMVLQYCGLDHLAVDKLSWDGSGVLAYHVALAEAQAYHNLGRFKAMQKQFAKQVRRLAHDGCLKPALQSALWSTKGEAARMCMGQPPLPLLILLAPYLLGSYGVAQYYFSRSRRCLSPPTDGARADRLAADKAIDAWVRSVTLNMRLIDIVSRTLGGLCAGLLTRARRGLRANCRAIMDVATQLGFRDHYLNAWRRQVRLDRALADHMAQPSPDMASAAAELAAEYELVTSPLGRASMERDLAEELEASGQWSEAAKHYAYCREIAKNIRHPLEQGKAEAGLSRCMFRMGRYKNAYSAAANVATCLLATEGFGNRALGLLWHLAPRVCWMTIRVPRSRNEHTQASASPPGAT